MIFHCSICDKEFSDSHKDRKFCSPKCYTQFKIKRPEKQILMDLYISCKLSTYKVSKILNTNPQTIRCWLKYYDIPIRNRSEAAVNDSELRSVRYKDKNNPNWKDGISSLSRRIRGSGKYKNWRKNILLRDGNSCVKCGNVENQEDNIWLEAHHIKGFSEYPDLRFDLDNGITLCILCHREETFSVNK